MTIFLPQYFELLKANVLSKSNLKSITPSDCKTLSAEIFDKTKFSLSETTLKRVFGFAHSKFNPSLFTIDVMAKYCGYAGWDDFCENQSLTSERKSEQGGNWDTLKQNANKVTSFTLQALKNKSGIPYNQTIKRRFVDDHFEEFLQGDYSATVFCAPSGYGKTIGLCHWIEQRLQPAANNISNDIVLFFSSSALMNVFLSGRDLNNWLLSLLGYTNDNSVNSLMDITEKKDGNFFLVIDGLDEHAYKPDQFQLLLNQLMDVLSLYKYSPWFKLVLTMRTGTWVNNIHQLETDASKWFKGFIPRNENLTVNVPLFSVPEIKALCQKINPAIQNFLAIEKTDNFNHPLYFQFYYKEYKDDFTLNNIDNVSIYELISTFILNKVYLGHHSADKLAFLKIFISAMDLDNQVYEVYKPQITAAIKQYNSAYNELLAVGFIRELNTSSGIHYNTQVQFNNANFLEYTLAKTLLQNNDFIFNEKLLILINEKFNTSHKLNIIKWCIVYATKTGQQNCFDVLPCANLNVKEKSELVFFLGDLLNKSTSRMNNAEAIVQYFSKDSSDEFFNYFFGLEFLNDDYAKTLQTLLKFDLSSRQQIITYTGLATIALLHLDIPKLEKHLDKLKTFPQHTLQKFVISPVKCLETIVEYFKYNTIRKDFFADVTRFYFNPLVHERGFKNDSSNELIYLLTGFSLLICKKPFKVTRFLNALQQLYKKPTDSFSPYCYLTKMITAESYNQLGQHDKVLNLYGLIAQTYSKNEHVFTPYMKSLFYALKMKKAIIKDDLSSIPGYMSYLTEINNRSGNNLSLVFVYFSLLSCNKLMLENPQFYKQVQYDITRLLREKGLGADLFANMQVLQ